MTNMPRDNFLVKNNQLRGGRMALIGFSVAAFLILLSSSLYTVGAGQHVVIYDSLAGGVQPEPVGEGLHWKMPFFQQAIKYNTRERLYDTSAASASRDLQEVRTTVAVRYAPESAWVPWLHRTFGPGYASVIIAPAVQESVKATTAKYNAEELVTKRAEVKSQIRDVLCERLTLQHISRCEMDITDFQFSESFDLAIEAKVTAEQRALEEKNRLEQIRFQAQQQIERARGEAEAVRINAEAEANKTRLINVQLATSPLYLQYLWLQTWNGTLPTVVAGDQLDLLYGLPAMQEASR